MSVTIEFCRCGGILKADYSVPGDILEVVTAHHATRRHRDWSASQPWVTPAERPAYNAVVTDASSGRARLAQLDPDDAHGADTWDLVDDADMPIEVVVVEP